MYYPTIDVVDAHIIKYDPIRWLGVSKEHRWLAIVHIARMPSDVRCKYALERDSPTVMQVHLGKYNANPTVAKSHLSSLSRSKNLIKMSPRQLSVGVTKFNAVNVLRLLLKDEPYRTAHDWRTIIWEGISTNDCVECLTVLVERNRLSGGALGHMLWVSFFHNRVRCFLYICSLSAVFASSRTTFIHRVLDFANDSIEYRRRSCEDMHVMLHALWNSELATGRRFVIVRYVLTRDHLPLLKMLLVDISSNTIDASDKETTRWIIHAALQTMPARQCLRWMATFWKRKVNEALKVAGYRTFI